MGLDLVSEGPQVLMRPGAMDRSTPSSPVEAGVPDPGKLTALVLILHIRQSVCFAIAWKHHEGCILSCSPKVFLGKAV